MFNLFSEESTIKIYGQKWQIIKAEEFNPKDLKKIESAVIEESDFGLACRCNVIGGGYFFIPLSTTSKLQIGDNVDLSECVMLTLERNGETINKLMEKE